MTHRQTLNVLLAKRQCEDALFPDWETDQYVGRILSDTREELRRTEVENRTLKAELAKANDNCSPKKVKLMERSAFLQEGIQLFLNNFVSACPIPLPLETFDYSAYMYRHDPKDRYDYPQNPGFAIFQPHAILETKNSRHGDFYFIVGSDTDGHRWKFRYFRNIIIWDCPSTTKNLRSGAAPGSSDGSGPTTALWN